jgi:hypothetical protein
MKIGAAVLVSLLALGAAIAAQRPQPSPQSDSYSAGVTAILVDVVVRDKRGRPVVDLTADDFEIQEDQVPQRLGSFSVVERGGGIGITVGRRVSGPPAAAPEAAPRRRPHFRPRRIIRPSHSSSTRSGRSRSRSPRRLRSRTYR